jgi:glycosyltransferase involved in cell wall biosynthesis
MDNVSVILPVYNESECIEETLIELVGVLRSLGNRFEVICVNDGSDDDSGAILKRLRADMIPEMRILELDPNSGQSMAFCVGFRYARYPIVVTMDADGQNAPGDIPRILKGMAGADMCCGYRADRQDTWAKRAASRIGNRIRNAVLKSDIIDTGCSLKAFRAHVLQDIPALDGVHRFLPNICLMQGGSIHQLPVQHRPRTKGNSKYTNWGRLLKTVPDLLAFRWMRQRTRLFRVTEVS